MRTGHRAGRWVPVALVAALALAGCSSTVDGEAFYAGLEVAKPTVPPAEGTLDPAEAPVVGTCSTIAEGQQSAPLDPPPPVECSGDHNAETAVVGDSGLADDAPHPAQADLDDPDSRISAALADLCDLDVVREYLGGDSLDDPYAWYAAYLPTAEQWAAGARWIRCDVFYGYLVPEPAPGILAGALAGSDPARHRTCFVGSPADYGVAPCSEPHEAEPVGTEVAALPEGAPYPDEPTRRSVVGSCTNVAQDYGGGEVPNGYVVDVWVDTAEEWPDYSYGRCVLVPAGGGRTTTTVRG
ncbi:septum formation family protein [Geodermatophilus sp. FMUSA9-8]|uniref:septum formation family protein n=1 Tax=Geodermatophilus sp. FMUSA9-8 TaxID=3120155 RepID=UPI003009BC73